MPTVVEIAHSFRKGLVLISLPSGNPLGQYFPSCNNFCQCLLRSFDLVVCLHRFRVHAYLVYLGACLRLDSILGFEKIRNIQNFDNNRIRHQIYLRLYVAYYSICKCINIKCYVLTKAVYSFLKCYHIVSYRIIYNSHVFIFIVFKTQVYPCNRDRTYLC